MTLASLQPDLAHRYRLIGAILAELRPASPDGCLRLLDVGSGPESLVSVVMPPWCELHRTDVDTFGRDDIAKLIPGEPLPFPDGAFDVVLALEVLEHVALPDRPLFLDECLRVSSRAVIVSTPLGTSTTRHIESVFRRVAEQASGKPVPFLEEHAEYGLPDPQLTASALSRRGAGVVTLDNAPAAEWLLANFVDFLYALHFGDGDEKAAQNLAQNRVLPTSRVGSPHYRRVYCASRDADDLAAWRSLAERQTNEAPALAPEALAEFAVERLRSVVSDLETRHARHLEIKDTRIAQLDQHVTGLEAAIAELRSGLELQQQHIRKLEVEAMAAAAAAAAREATPAPDEAERLRLQLRTQEEATASERDQRDRLERQLARVNLRLLQTGQELTAVRQSTTWRVTAPLRRTVSYGRGLSLRGAVQWRRVRQRGRPPEAWPTRLSRRILSASGLFDPGWYLATYPDVAGAAADPLDHFLASGAKDGRRPTPLFDTAYYLSRYPDVGTSGLNPLLHYVLYGAREGRWANPAFDSAYYLRTYPDVAASRLTPLAHYIRFGAAEGRRPSEEFDPAYYLETNPDVRAAGLNPLEHYVLAGAYEGRLSRQLSVAHAAAATGAAARVPSYVPPPGLLPWFNPLNTVLDPALADTPRLNVLVPGLGMRHMSGGPNTLLAFAGRLAGQGIPMRLVSTDAPVDDDLAPFWAHLTALAGGSRPPDIELVDAHDRSKPWRIGENDLFLASAWWTAQQVKYALRLTRSQRFVYFIQDYEPLLHAASTAQALAEETYTLDYVPIVNTRVLADFLAERRIGRFADPAFAGAAIVFEPALDRALFHPAPRAAKSRRRLLFYARPTNGLRNLFELAVAALQQSVAEGLLPPDEWEFLGMGEAFAPVDLGQGAVLRPAPWLGLDAYAEQMRQSDVLLSLMLSPHPSYPPLEMAACGGVAVTTVYANKDAARLAAISPRIIGVAATIEGLVSGLSRAVTMAPAGKPSDGGVALPKSWDEAFADAVRHAATRVRELAGVPSTTAGGATHPVSFPGYHWPRQAYEIQRLDALERRRVEYRSPSHPLLFSLITPVWNTDPAFLEELCLSVLGQDCPSDLFEWVVVDNASTRLETRAVLGRWSTADPRVRVVLADRNLGILGGLRSCLEHARGRYVVTVDHDDLLTPDALRVLGHTLAGQGFPPLAYSDEDKIDGARLRDPYFKPDWDPVLFAHSCYTSHVGVLDRERALALGAYTDPGTEGSHDWDSFVRFWSAGVSPVHVPEVLYTWRMHPESTAGNIDSKPYVFDSQRRVLEKFVQAARPAVHCDVVPSALFAGAPDWRLLTEREPHVLSAVFGPTTAPEPRVAGEATRSSRAVSTLDELARVAREAADTGSLLHLVCRGVHSDEETWAREAASLRALFPDTAIVGGPLLLNGRVIDGARIAGVGRGLDAVDAGRYAHDPGYFAQAWKPHTVHAVPAGHIVIDPSFMIDVIGDMPPGLLATPSRVGPWLSAAAHARRRRVVYSPYLRAAINSASIEHAWNASDLGAVHAFGDLLGDRSLWSQHLSFSMNGGPVPRDPGADPYPLAAPDLFVESYPAWLEADRVARCLTKPRSAGPRPTVAVLTSVWIRTPADLFAETIDSVLKQTAPPDEWIVLRNGPVDDDVAAEIARAATAPFVRVLDAVENVGIIGAMRVCLAAATADYVLPLDADDLLEGDALEILVAWAASRNADLAFSDEDHLANGVFDHPFLRPGFDAVLHSESAYIWHACLLRRERAVSVGAYQDSGAEYCHDWDTLLRIAAAGGEIVHVPHLLYHWRTHASSHSNSGQQHPGTLASTRHLIEQTIARTSNPERYRAATFPRDRGLPEFYIERIPAGAAGELFVRVAGPDSPAVDDAAPDIQTVVTVESGEAFSTALGVALDDLSDDAIVYLAAADITSVAKAGIWDALKLFELHPSVDVVGGRVLDSAGVVIEAGRVCVDQGAWADPFIGYPANAPGPFALALKAHRIDRPAANLMAVRVSLLRDLIAGEHIECLDDVADACAASCLARGAWLAYTPLLEGTRLQRPAVSHAPLAEARRLRGRAIELGHTGTLPLRHGAAALFLYHLRRKLP